MDPSSPSSFTSHPNVNKPQSISDMSKGRVILSSQDQHRHLTPIDDLATNEYRKPPSIIDVAQNLWNSDQPVEILVENDNREAGVVDQDEGRPVSIGDLSGGREKSRPDDHYYETVKPPSHGDFGQHKHSNNGQGYQDQYQNLTRLADDNKKQPTITGVAQNQRYSHQPIELLDENDNRSVVDENEDAIRSLSITNLAGGREKFQPSDRHYENDKPLSKGHFKQPNIITSGHGVAQNLRYLNQTMDVVAKNNNYEAVVENQDGRPLSITDLVGGREKSQPYDHRYKKDKSMLERDFGQRNQSSSDHDPQVELLVRNDNHETVVTGQEDRKPLSRADLASARKQSRPYDHNYENDKPPSQGDFGQHDHGSSGQVRDSKTTSNSKELQ